MVEAASAVVEVHVPKPIHVSNANQDQHSDTSTTKADLTHVISPFRSAHHTAQ
jgi:hypothetical protein